MTGFTIIDWAVIVLFLLALLLVASLAACTTPAQQNSDNSAVTVIDAETDTEMEEADDAVLMLQGKVYTMTTELPESPHLFVLETVSPAVAGE